MNIEIPYRRRALRAGALAPGIVLALALGLTGNALAWGGCEHQRKLNETLDVSGSDRLRIIAAAGDLEVRGDEGADTVTVEATICASKAAWAEEAGLSMEGGREATVAVVIPSEDGMSWGNDYVYVDLSVTVPDDLSLDIRDSSGDVDVSRVSDVAIKDSSGDIDVSSSGSVSVEDSSGDIELNRIDGDVTIVQDSSGDIRGSDIEGSVIVARDSSGDIRFRDVRDDFLVERDSSGDVVAQGVGGDFSVLRDGSGDISYRDVAGEVDIPEDS